MAPRPSAGRWKKTHNISLFECFPYVCPEPVLVKRSFLVQNCAKDGERLFLTYLSCDTTSGCCAAMFVVSRGSERAKTQKLKNKIKNKQFDDFNDLDDKNDKNDEKNS